jgi:hypothetical protein
MDEYTPTPCPVVIIEREWRDAIAYLSNAVGAADHVAAVNRAFHIACKTTKGFHGECSCCLLSSGRRKAPPANRRGLGLPSGVF